MVRQVRLWAGVSVWIVQGPEPSFKGLPKVGQMGEMTKLGCSALPEQGLAALSSCA